MTALPISTASRSGAEPGPAFSLDPDLSHAVASALGRADDIVLVLALEGDRLRITAANPAAQRTTGYAGLAGEDFGLLASPQADPATLAAIDAAARDGQPYQGQLRSRTAAGRDFWFGLQLLPASDAGGRRRFLLIGRDVSEQVREREQGQAIQSLLAKVFVTVDVPLYILDPLGRFLMTNPALDRLLESPPGALHGKTALESYAPDCRAALSAARTQQDIDGRDYTLSATLLKPGGGEVRCQITAVMVKRADQNRFRVVTVRPEAVEGIRAAGRIQLIGLEEVRSSLGPAWEALKDRAMGMAEHVLRRRLAPRDTLCRTDNQGFVVCFADVSEEEATFRAAGLAREIRRRLIGEGETPEVAHVFSAATEVPPDAAALPPSELATLVQDRISQRLSSIQEAARARLHETLEATTYATETVRARGREEAVGMLVQLPQATEHAFQAAVAVLPAAETAGLNLDAMLLGLAHEYGLSSASQNSKLPIFVPLSADVLLVRRHMEACIEMCRGIGEPMRQRLVFLFATRPEAGNHPLNNILPRLRPFCRSIGVTLEALELGELDLRGHGISIVLLEAGAVRAPGWATKGKPRIASLHAQRCRLMARAAARTEAPELFAAGVDLVCAPSAPAESPAAAPS